jgi:hypothetical protein
MTTLRKFKFVELPRGSNPVMNRRVKLIRKLEEQIKLANDSHYLRVETHMRGERRRAAPGAAGEEGGAVVQGDA